MKRSLSLFKLLFFVFLASGFSEAKIQYNKRTNLYPLKVRGWFGFVSQTKNETEEGVSVDHSLLSALGDRLVFQERGYGTVFRPFFGDSRVVQADSENGRNLLFVSSEASENQERNCSLRIACLLVSVKAFENAEQFSKKKTEFLSRKISEEEYLAFLYNSLCPDLKEFRAAEWLPFLKRKGVQVDEKSFFETLPKSEKGMKDWLNSKSGKLVGVHAYLPERLWGQGKAKKSVDEK